MTNSKDDATLEELVGDKVKNLSSKNVDLTPEVHKIHLSDTGVVDRNLGLYMDFHALVYRTPTNTHKGEKARTSLEWCVNNNVDFALFGNYSKELSTSSDGSGIDALNYFSQFYDTKVVVFEPLDKNEREAYITIESDGKSMQRIKIHLDTKGYLSPGRLEQIFRCCLKGKSETRGDPLAKLYQSKMAKAVAEIAKGKSENPKYKAITNIYEFDPETKAYFYQGKLKERLAKNNTILISPIGSGETLIGGVKSLGPTYNEYGERIGPIYIGVTTKGNPLARWLRAFGSRGNNRLDTSYSNPAHDEIIRYMQDESYDIRLLILEEDDKTISAGVAHRIKSDSIGDLNISETGSYGLAPLLQDNCMTQGEYLKHLQLQHLFPHFRPFDGVAIFPNLRKIDENGMLRESKLVLPIAEGKHQVYVVYTGCSQKAA